MGIKSLDNNKKLLTSGKEKLGFLEFNGNKTEAYLTIFPSVDGKGINPEEIISSLHNEGVLNIDTDTIRFAIKNKEFNQKILVANGILPTKGEDAYLLYQFGTEEECPPIEVIPGQILVIKVPPKNGIPGITVTGEEIIPPPGKDIEIIPGKNTAISQDRLRIYATEVGRVTWIANKVEVKKRLEITNDIDEKEGNKEEITEVTESQVFLSNIPQSAIVKANSLSEAKEMGGELLGLPPAKVDCQMNISEKNPFLMRIFPLGVKGPWGEGWREKIKEEITRSKMDNIDGMFEFFNTDTGLYLSVSPHKGPGKKVTLQDILNYIEERKFIDINKTLLKKAIENPSPNPVLVGARQRLLELDGKVEVQVAPDNSKAIIIVKPPKQGGIPASFEDAMCALRENNVVAGIDEKAVAKAVFAQSDKPVLVAEAIPPIPGEPAKLEYKFRIDRSKVELVEDEHGRIDFKRLNLIENVRAGQVLVVKRPPGKGTPGKLVNGLEIPAPQGQDVKMPVGRNTEIAPNGTELIATINGQVLLVGDKVNVEDTIEIKGNVDLSTGNIYFLGTVIVKGSVEDGFEIEATGDIQIKNSVGKCFISAGGSIAIGEGVKGKKSARLFAGEHIFAKYIENAKVDAKGTVQVTQEIMHSQIDAGKSVLLEGKQRGSIIGGKTRAGDEIIAREIGAPAGTYTRIEVGGTPRVREQLANLNRVYHKDINRLEIVKKEIATLQHKKKEEKGNFVIEKEAKLQRLIREHNKLTVRLQRYTDQKEFLELRIKEALGGVLHISHTLFQGVSVGIKNANLKIKDNYNSVSLGLKGNEVGIFPYGMVKGY